MPQDLCGDGTVVRSEYFLEGLAVTALCPVSLPFSLQADNW